ncbi:OmpA family protein [Vibrio salinus]|uniref:OmpA family protein n=1 Tax=Vibrio salinus TaxID=2899784 RepID=UPI001E31B902|nr:OmpA family protein [Vibrio salinus]MCE0496309.1 OmpA family protein [Vibrio salinus]
MMNNLFRIYAPIIVALIMSGCTSLSENTLTDEYSYIQTPATKQSADLNDIDKDGVINARDRCESTETGAKINNNGCGHTFGKNEKKQLHILFAHNSSVINPIFAGQIKEMAAFLADYPSTSIEINGYASKVGDENSNLKLSEKRAQEVKKWLINYGVAPSRIRIVGHGESNLVIDDDSEFAATKNRRVTATVVTNGRVVEKQWTIFSKIPRNADSY